MSDHIRTRATPEQEALYYARSGATSRPPKPAKRKKRMVEFCVFQEVDGWTMQLPLETVSDNANGVWRSKSNAAEKQRNLLLGKWNDDGVKIRPGVLESYWRSIDRAAISGIVLTRLSPGRLDAHDNLRQAFKHIVDDVCIWINLGSEICPRDFSNIGRHDDKLIGTGRVTCDYEQTTNETDPKAHGIRIRLRLGSQPTLTSEP